MTSESFVSASGLKQKKKESDQAKRPGILLFVSFLSFSVRLAWFACFVVVVVVVFTRQRQQCGKKGAPVECPLRSNNWRRCFSADLTLEWDLEVKKRKQKKKEANMEKSLRCRRY